MESTEIEESLARQAIELTRQARVAGDHPFGALLVLDGADFLIPCKDLFDRAVESVSIAGPMLLNEAREVHLGFWPPSAARRRMHRTARQE